MLSAFMVDGFGWFGEGAYRRAFLLFDEIDYLLPSRVDGPLVYLPRTLESPEYKARFAAVGLTAPELKESVARDLDQPAFLSAVERVPPRDRDYATRVIATDPELAPLLRAFPAAPDVVAISLLSEKLILFGAREGRIPIVGQEYAWDILAAKLRLDRDDLATAAPPTALGSPREEFLCGFIAADLASGFLTDEEILATSFEVLAKFKAKNADLLKQHHLQLMESAQEFAGLRDGPELKAHIRTLQTKALKEQDQLERRGREAWLGAGLTLLSSGIKAATAAGAFLPLVCFVRHPTLGEMLMRSIPAAGLAAGAALKAISKSRPSGPQPYAYLFGAGNLINRHWRQRSSARA